MKRINNILHYVFSFTAMLFALLVLNVIIMAYISGVFDENKRIAASISVTASELRFDSGRAVMSERGRERIDSLDGFAVLIDESGSVIWDYKKPADIPTTFSLSDVASFSRWYLCDYPVYSHILELPDGSRMIFVLGQPKDTLWKYQLTVGINSLTRYPYVFAADAVVLFTVPLLLTKRLSRRREKERAEWIAGVSHDVRTPLTMATLATVKIINESTDAEASAAARQILSHEMRLKSLIENLNADNRMQYGHGSLARERVGVPSVIRDVLCAFADANDGQLYDFGCDISREAENCTVLADESLVRRLLENLIGNSVRHNPDGCTVNVALRRLNRTPFRSRYELRVSDDGCGVSPGILAALSGRREGTALRDHGLGLRVVSHVIRNYRWKIRYASSPGKGFTAVVELH